MTQPIDAYRQHSTVCNTVTFSPWTDEKVQPLRPGRTSETPRRRPKRTKPELYDYEDEPGTEKTAYSTRTNKLRNTMARPRNYWQTTKATTLRTEEPMQRTPALPDPDAPEEEMVRVAQSEVDTLFEAMEQEEQKTAAKKPIPEPESALQTVAPTLVAAKGLGVLGGAAVGAGVPIATMGNQPKAVTKDIVPKLLSAGGRTNDIPIRPVSSWMRAHYVPENKMLARLATKSPAWEGIYEGIGRRRLGLPGEVNPFIAAHEVGHATGSRKIIKALGPTSLVSGLGGVGLLAHAIATAEKGEELPTSAYLAPGVAAIGPATRQAEELRATLRGAKLLRKAGIPAKNLLRQGIGQQLGYLGAHLGKIAPYVAGAYGLKKYVEQEPDEVKSAGLLKFAEGEESGLPSWLAPALAGAGGLGAYAVARHPFKGPKGSQLAKIRELAGGRMVRGDVPTLDPKASWFQKLKHSLRHGPSIDPDDPAQVAKLLQSQKKGKPAIWAPGDEMAPKGTFNPALGPDPSRKAQSRALGIVEDLDDKLLESQLLQKHVPGTSARTTGIQDVLDKYKLKLRKGKNLPEDLAKLQEALKKEFGAGGYMMKTRSGAGAVDLNVASSGVFPTEATDLAKVHKQWRAMRPEFQQAAKGSPTINKAIEQFRTRPGYEGRVIDEALRDNVILQEKLDLQRFGPRISKYMKSKGFGPTREFRVHVVGGKAVPSMSMPRYPSPAALIDYVRARKAARWAQKSVLDKLPESHRALSMGMDVAPLRKGGHRVIETNVGGASGLLDNPLTTHQLHKAVTGRYSKPAAGILGAAGAAGGAGAGLLARDAKKEPGLLSSPEFTQA